MPHHEGGDARNPLLHGACRCRSLQGLKLMQQQEGKGEAQGAAAGRALMQELAEALARRAARGEAMSAARCCEAAGCAEARRCKPSSLLLCMSACAYQSILT